jgi:adenosylcobinamide-GDP ribazoletransferase
LIKRLLLAFQFLTVLPIRVKGDVTDKDVASAAAFFPAVGAFQGLATAVPAFLAAKVLPPDVSAVIAILFLVLSNYGFDLDGLADTFDGLAIKSTGDADRDRGKRLLVMKDSATGAMGVIALIVTILLKFVLMKTLLADLSVVRAAVLFFLMPVFSKWATVPAMYHGSSGRNDGLGRIFVEHARLRDVILATLVLSFFCLVTALPRLVGPSVAAGLAFCLSLLVLFYVFDLLAVRFLGKRFGGLTGDHFGALTETTEVIFLLAACVWL